MIATLYTVLAWLTLVIGTIAVLAGVAGAESGSGGVKAALALGGLLYVGLLTVFLFAAAALIRLLLSLEQSARETAQATRETVEIMSANR